FSIYSVSEGFRNELVLNIQGHAAARVQTGAEIPKNRAWLWAAQIDREQSGPYCPADCERVSASARPRLKARWNSTLTAEPARASCPSRAQQLVRRTPVPRRLN